MGDSPQAHGLIEGPTDAQHVTMDAAYDADHLRSVIAEDLGATAPIKRNPTRRDDRPIDWALSRTRRLVECVFNRIKRFRRIALRCEKTASSFKAFVDLACAMAWLAQNPDAA
ncbi:MAG: transposase [Pseudomonadota bacterium]